MPAWDGAHKPMSLSSQRVTQRSLQSLLLKRFGMAVATYAMTGLLCWAAVFAGLFHASPLTALTITALAAASQLVFLVLFLSHFNLRLSDPSLTEGAAVTVQRRARQHAGDLPADHVIRRVSVAAAGLRPLRAVCLLRLCRPQPV